MSQTIQGQAPAAAVEPATQTAVTPVEATPPPITSTPEADYQSARAALKNSPAAKPETPAPVEAVPPSTPTPEQPAASTADETARPEIPAEPKVESEPEDRLLPGRISTKQFNPMEQEAIALLREMRKEDPKANIADAYHLVEKRQAEIAATAPAPSVDPVENLNDQVAEIDEKLEQMAEEETLFGPEQAKLVQQRSDLAAKLAVERLKQEQAIERQNTQTEDAFSQSKAQAVQKYPSLAINEDMPISQLAAETQALVRQLQNPNHPKHSLLSEPHGPIVVADMAATALATKLAKLNKTTVDAELSALKGSPKPQPAAPAAPAPPKITPTSGALSPAPTPPAPTLKDFLNSPDSMKGESIEAKLAEMRRTRKPSLSF